MCVCVCLCWHLTCFFSCISYKPEVRGKALTGFKLDILEKLFGNAMHLGFPGVSTWASLVVQTVKSLPAVRETQVRSLGQEDPLRKGIATCLSIFDWEIPWTEELGRL